MRKAARTTTTALLDRLLAAVGDAQQVLILPHNDPDPDAIASAVGLRHLLTQRLGVAITISAAGIVGRAENRAVVRYLGSPLQKLSVADLQQPWPLALVDTQPGAGNNALPPDRQATIVLDHHAWREATATAAFSDIRPETGSTSTIITEYLQAAELEPPTPLATALFYGIKTDTMGLGRNASPNDAAAYFYLQQRVDTDALVEIERARVPAEYFRSLVTTLQATRVFGEVLISEMGLMAYPDMAAQMADLLLRLDGIRWVVCIGQYGDSLVLAVRTRRKQGGAGQLVREVVGEKGTAGGHGTLAGGQVRLNGQDPVELADLLIRRTLCHLDVPSGTVGEPLV